MSFVVTDEVEARFSVEHDFLAQPAVYQIQQYTDGSMLIINEMIALRPEHQNKGYGVRMFARQAEVAKELKIRAIHLWAAGSKNQPYNGYYTWARYGFDTDLQTEERAALPPELSGATTIQHLMTTVDGRKWWVDNGTGRFMSFYTVEESQWNCLGSYLDEKKVRI